MTQPNDASSREHEEVRRVSGELAGRLGRLGIRVTGSERPEELLDMLEAVERFEAAVQARGGDLMMDEGPHGRTTEPDEQQFALPLRREHESVAHYVERLARATDDVRRHPPRAD